MTNYILEILHTCHAQGAFFQYACPVKRMVIFDFFHSEKFFSVPRPGVNVLTFDCKTSNTTHKRGLSIQAPEALAVMYFGLSKRWKAWQA